MLNNFRNLQSLFWSQGSRWLLFRVAYALRKRTGYIRKQMPQYQWQDRPLATWLKQGIPFTPDAYANWRKHESPKFFFHSRTPGEHRDYPVTARQGSRSEWSASVDEARVSNNYPSNPQIAVDEAERLFAGELKYFGRTYYQVGFPPHWHIDPITGTSLDAQKHWSELSDDLGAEPFRDGVHPRPRLCVHAGRAVCVSVLGLDPIVGRVQSSQHGTQLDGRSRSRITSPCLDVRLLPIR